MNITGLTMLRVENYQKDIVNDEYNSTQHTQLEDYQKGIVK